MTDLKLMIVLSSEQLWEGGQGEKNKAREGGQGKNSERVEGNYLI